MSAWWRRAGAGWIGVLAIILACEGERDPAGRVPAGAVAPGDSISSEGKAMPTRPIEDVQEEHTPALMAIPGVVGTFIGATADGRPCIRIMVVERTPELEKKLPRQLEGYPVEIVESGTIRPLDDGR